jgi:actin-related protein
VIRQVVLTGGSTAFPGMAARVQKELEALKDGMQAEVRVVGPLPHVSAWAGGSLVGQRSGFESRCKISKSDYYAGKNKKAGVDAAV